MRSHILTVLVSALAVVSAGPLQKRCPTDVAATSTASETGTATDAASTSAAEAPAMPTTGDATELPAPSGTLKHIAIGHGIQNYSCSDANVTATSAGALAVLYDISDLYSSMSNDQVYALSANILRTNDVPLNLKGNSVNQYAADTAAPFHATDAAVTVDGVSQPLTPLGRHYFDASLRPTFDLYASAAKNYFNGGKLFNVKAPTNSDIGLLNTGAVDWLQLGDKGTSVGLTQVYRLVTAGGNPLSCDEAGETFSVPYSAEYWFYG